MLYNIHYCKQTWNSKLLFRFGLAGSYFSLLWRWRLWRTHEIRLLPIWTVNFMHIYDYNTRCLSCITKGIDCINILGIIQKYSILFQLLNDRGKILMCYVGSLLMSYAILSILQFNKHNRFDHCYLVGLWIFLRNFFMKYGIIQNQVLIFILSSKTNSIFIAFLAHSCV